MRSDLTLRDPHLEAAFQRTHALRNMKLEKQFHLARALTWFAILVRVAATEHWRVVATLAAGALTTLLPAFADHLPQQRYLRWRLPIQISDNVLQVALGVYTHHVIYPSKEGVDPTAFQMVAVLLTGNGVAWLLFCSLWGSLPFRYALPQQAALTLILLVYNDTLCRDNVAMQLAYATIGRLLAARTLVALARLTGLQFRGTFYAATRTCASAVLGAPSDAREAVRQACVEAMRKSAAAAAGAAAASASASAAEDVGATAAHGAELCLRLQPLSLLLLGFVFPTWYVWTSELRLRTAMVEQQRAADAAHGGRPAGAPPLPSPHHMPTLAEYAMFAVPAVAAMFTFAVA